MQAAIYARYSSDLQSDSSIDDQIRLCRQKAHAMGAEVVEVYADAAISGARLMTRPAIVQMLADAKLNRMDIVITEAIDRLSRDQEDIAGIFKRLRHSDVVIFSLAEGEISELHIGLKGTMNALFLKDLAARVRRGQGGRVEVGRAPGGLTYGYRVVKKYDDKGEPIRGLREIHPEHAAVVRRIYEQYASGSSPRAIAGQLNADRVPSPRGGKWNASTITGQKKRLNGLFHNPIYVGRIVYNRQGFKKDPDTGARTAVTNPQSTWITKDVPELRIIEGDLWEDVQRQLRQNKLGIANPVQRRRPKHLLSGLVFCGCCQGNYIVTDRQHMSCGRRRESRDCENGRRVQVDKLEEIVLSALSHHLTQPEAISAFVEEYEAASTAIKDENRRRAADALKQAKDLTAKIDRIVAAIANGVDTPAMRRQLIEMERQLECQEEALRVSDRDPVVELHPNLADAYRSHLKDLRSALSSPPCRQEAAGLIRGLIERIVLHPASSGRGLEAEIVGRMAALADIAFNGNKPEREKNVSRIKRVISMASPTGFEPVLPT